MNEMDRERREKGINLLKAYFADHSEVAFAFVFGSRAAERDRGNSDWDIAVYFKPQGPEIEWEEKGRRYPQEDACWKDCIDLLKTDKVDLLVLNRAPAHVADIAIKGLPLAIKDRRLFLSFMLAVTREAENYREFVDEYYAIKERSFSLSAVDSANLKKIISFLEAQAALYGYFQGLSEKRYAEDVHARNDVERWAENMMNACIDISKIVLAGQKKPIPDTYRDAKNRRVGPWI